MITCMFIGSYVYDLNLYEKLQTAVGNVIAKDNAIEFLFSRRSIEFYYLSFWVVLKSKCQFPNKKITMTLITKDNYEENLLQSGIKLFGIPVWAFDKIISISLDKEQPLKQWNKLERKMICESNYVITHCYSELHGVEYNLLKFVMNQRNLIVINILNRETADFINETIKMLPSNNRLILEQINLGHTYVSLARATNVSISSLKTNDYNCRKHIRSQILNKLKLEQIEQKKILSGKCSIILPDSSTNKLDTIRLRLKESIRFLIESMNVTSFMITPSDCLNYINHLFSNRKELDLTVVTCFLEHNEEEQNPINMYQIPRFAEIQNINYNVKSKWARYLFSIKTMIAQSEYVICNFSGTTPLEDQIRSYIKKQNDITVIDLGKSSYTTEH